MHQILPKKSWGDRSPRIRGDILEPRELKRLILCLTGMEDLEAFIVASGRGKSTVVKVGWVS
jgi:hypothetical protein